MARRMIPAALEHVQRRIAEAEDPLLGPADVLEQAVGGDAEHPLGPDVVDADLLEPGERAHAAEEEVALGEPEDCLDDPPVHQREITGVVRDADVGEVVEDPVERLVGELHEQAGLALDPPAVDDVVALAPVLHELLDQLGRVLKVAVEQHAGVLGGDLHAAAERRLRAEIPRVADADHAPVVSRDAPG